jgi:hypothetical protein
MGDGVSFKGSQSGVAMKLATPKPAVLPAGGKTFDPMLDPLPQPEVVESDSDTVWDLWQESIQPQESRPDSRFTETTYKDTEPMGLPDTRSLA